MPEHHIPIAIKIRMYNSMGYSNKQIAGIIKVPIEEVNKKIKRMHLTENTKAYRRKKVKNPWKTGWIKI